MRARIQYITLALILSLTIVMTGSGVGMIYCHHTGHTKIALSPVKSCHQDSRTTRKSACMSLTVVKLAPSTVSQQQLFDFQPAVTSLLSAASFSLADVSIPESDHRAYEACAPPSPPRQYLRLLTTLII